MTHPNPPTLAPPLVVGFDGSVGAGHALRWAAAEAGRHEAPLHVVHVVPPAPGGTSADAGRTILESARAALVSSPTHTRGGPGSAMPGVATIETHPTFALRRGPVAQALLRYAGAGSVLVLGRCGTGSEPSLGSTTLSCANRGTRTAIAVIGAGSDVHGPDASGVLVGVDGAARTRAAVGFACVEARRHHTVLTALSAWDLPAPYILRYEALDDDVERRRREAERRLAETLEPFQRAFADVDLVGRVERGHPVDVLTRAGRTAELLVIGRRGHGTIGGQGLGSVTDAVLYHTPCPLVIVPPHP